MLGSDELREVARLKRLTLANAERDYIQDVLLFGIYSEVGKELVFKGGTCLYKLHKLGRFSEDLDFTLNKRIDIEEAVEKVVHRLKYLGVSGNVKEVKRHPKEMNFRLLFRGPLYRGGREGLCFIPLNVSLREKVALKPERMSIRPIYREIPSFDVFSMQKEEMLAEKTRAVMTREKARDIYDMWFLLTDGIKPDMNLINRKLAAHGIKFSTTKFAERVDKMAQVWKVDLKNLVLGELPEFEAVKNSVIKNFTIALS